MKLNWPLMKNNISRADLDGVIEYLKQDDPILTQSAHVEAFETEWSEWLGVKYSVFVNSGSSANIITMEALRVTLDTDGEIIVPTLTWASDITSVIRAGFRPVFVDIDPFTLGMDNSQVIKKLSKNTKAVFLTHVLGYCGLSQKLLDDLKDRGIPLIEDVCESHGASFAGRKLGAFGIVSNFSFYYAHHMSTIEGGMVCTDDPILYDTLRALRSHGLVREMKNPEVRKIFSEYHPDLSPDFIFACKGFNFRSTEINAIIGRSQLKRLDANNKKRGENLKLFLNNLDPVKYQIDFATEGSSNYALTLVLTRPEFRDKTESMLRAHGVEFRRGMSGGGNQLRQPYLKGFLDSNDLNDYSRVEHVHFNGYYIGNYPDLESWKILRLCSLLNDIA